MMTVKAGMGTVLLPVGRDTGSGSGKTREPVHCPTFSEDGASKEPSPTCSGRIDQQLRPMGLYVHFPFCIAKCSYCDFYSIPYRADWAEEYCKALLWEIRRLRVEQGPSVIGSIYLGGGTPSLMKADPLQQLMDLILGSFHVVPDCEITMEANPGTISLDSLKAVRAAGINRISLGVQSFDESLLQLLGRIHSREEVFRSVENVLKAGIQNYGLDLIYGIPGQSLSQWCLDLQEATRLSPRHLSCYLLQMDEMVPLAVRLQNKEIEGLSEEDEAAMYYSAINHLKNAGYHHYEISNFCRPGSESRHNLNYWEAGEYLGIGAGAVSFQNGRRYRNIPEISQYIRSLVYERHDPPREVMESMEGTELGIDAMIMGLRMTCGVNVPEFANRFGIDPLVVFQNAISKSCEEGLLEFSYPWLRLTSKGYFLSNRVYVRIMESSRY